MINLIFINDTYLCWTNSTADLLYCFITSWNCIAPIKSFGPSISFSWSWSWTTLYRNLFILNLAVWNKYCSVLGQIFLMPARQTLMKSQPTTVIPVLIPMTKISIYVFYLNFCFLRGIKINNTAKKTNRLLKSSWNKNQHNLFLGFNFEPQIYTFVTKT